MPEGTEILAGHDGTVTLAGNVGGYGLCVAIEGEAYEGHTLSLVFLPVITFVLFELAIIISPPL